MSYQERGYRYSSRGRTRGSAQSQKYEGRDHGEVCEVSSARTASRITQISDRARPFVSRRGGRESVDSSVPNALSREAQSATKSQKTPKETQMSDQEKTKTLRTGRHHTNNSRHRAYGEARQIDWNGKVNRFADRHQKLRFGHTEHTLGDKKKANEGGSVSVHTSAEPETTHDPIAPVQRELAKLSYLEALQRSVAKTLTEREIDGTSADAETDETRTLNFSNELLSQTVEVQVNDPIINESSKEQWVEEIDEAVGVKENVELENISNKLYVTAKSVFESDKQGETSWIFGHEDTTVEKVKPVQLDEQATRLPERNPPHKVTLSYPAYVATWMQRKEGYPQVVFGCDETEVPLEEPENTDRPNPTHSIVSDLVHALNLNDRISASSRDVLDPLQPSTLSDNSSSMERIRHGTLNETSIQRDASRTQRRPSELDQRQDSLETSPTRSASYPSTHRPPHRPPPPMYRDAPAETPHPLEPT